MILTIYTYMRDFVVTCKSQKSTTCNKELKLDRSMTRETKKPKWKRIKTQATTSCSTNKKCNSWKKNQKDEFTDEFTICLPYPF